MSGYCRINLNPTVAASQVTLPLLQINGLVLGMKIPEVTRQFHSSWQDCPEGTRGWTPSGKSGKSGCEESEPEPETWGPPEWPAWGAWWPEPEAEWPVWTEPEPSGKSCKGSESGRQN
jgi:hypothetical protein